MDVAEKTIVITGAGSGIGRALAIECARRGANVALADLNEAGLTETRKQLESVAQESQSCSLHQLDVSDLNQWRSFKQDVLNEHQTVDGIFNNAGIAFFGSIDDMSYAELDKVMAINFNGMVYGTKEFLPLIQARPEGLIANVSSVFGLFAMKLHAAYCASKFAIRGFTEVLAQELRDSKVTVASIHPGHIGTDISRNALIADEMIDPRNEAQQQTQGEAFKQNGLPPAEAAMIILDGLKAKQRQIMVGEDAVESDEMVRASPVEFVDGANDAAP